MADLRQDARFVKWTTVLQGLTLEQALHRWPDATFGARDVVALSTHVAFKNLFALCSVASTASANRCREAQNKNAR